MSSAPLRLEQRASDLRAAFDAQFARAQGVITQAETDLLAVRIGGDPYALRVHDLAGISSARKVVPVPSDRAEIVGVAGVRGAVVTVCSLSTVLGYAGAGAPLRWLASCLGASALALAFEELEGFLRVPRSHIHGAEGAVSRRQYVTQVVMAGAVARPIVDARSIARALEEDAGTSGSTKEQ